MRAAALSLMSLIAAMLMAGASHPVATPRVQATTYYVATTGSDSFAGTQAAPFLTIAHAASVAQAGDTVIVEDGTYSCSTCSGPGSELVPIPNSGTNGAPITFEAQNQYGAVLDGLDNTTAAGFSLAASVSYITIEGFEIEGFGATSGGGDAIDAFRSGDNNVTITGNSIHDIGRLCSDTTNSTGTGIYVSASDVTIQQNMIYDIGRYGPGENGCQPSEPYYQNHDHGIYLDGGSNIMIRNNIFFRCERGWAIQVYPHSDSNLSILNNTFLWGDPYRSDSFIILDAQVKGMRIENNIGYTGSTSGAYFIEFDGKKQFGTVANNVTYNGTIGSGAPNQVSFSANQDNTDPLLTFVGVGTMDGTSMPDAQLTIGSPAIDSGLTLSDVPNDFAGSTRTSPYDIGAYLYNDIS